MFFYSITALIKSVKKLSGIKSSTRIEKNQDNILLNQQAKTTNINILLNRVRLDKKKLLESDLYLRLYLQFWLVYR